MHKKGGEFVADFDLIGYALSCCGSHCPGLWLFVQIQSRTLGLKKENKKTASCLLMYSSSEEMGKKRSALASI